MGNKNDFTKIGDVYGGMLNNMKHNLIAEGKIGPAVKVGEIGQAPLIKGGPQETAGYVPAKIDRNKMSNKELKDNLYNIKTLSQPENLEEEEEDKKAPKKAPKKGTNKIAKKSGKIVRESINNFMRNKSIFDKLYENVMAPGSQMGDGEMEETDELDALGIDTEDDSAEDEVTFTLDRETAQKLHDVLMAQLGDSEVEEVEDAGDDLGDEDYETMEQDEQGFYDEDEEDLGHAGVNAKEPNMGKNNKVGNLKPQSGGATSAYTNKVGNDGDHGHALVNAKQPNMGTNNKVGRLKTGKSLFEQ